jgi:hypothetical protein
MQKWNEFALATGATKIHHEQHNGNGIARAIQNFLVDVLFPLNDLHGTSKERVQQTGHCNHTR